MLFSTSHSTPHPTEKVVISLIKLNWDSIFDWQLTEDQYLFSVDPLPSLNNGHSNKMLVRKGIV